MKIAIVGAGVSGIYAAHRLAPDHEVTLYEANGYLGGHTDTHHITLNDGACSVDTGFIVFNETHYPLFTAFIGELGVKSQPSNMSFSVSDKTTGLEYNATSIAGLFCRRRNLVRPGFYRMLIDVLRFYKRSPELLECSNDDELTIGAYLHSQGYGKDFVHNHIIPMASALWSSPPTTVTQFPARYFVSFMQNHNMLQITQRPVWRTVTGGSSQYVKAFERNFRGRVRVRSRVNKVTRTASGVIVQTDADSGHYDMVVLACHSDQALAVLDANDHERALLGAIPYQENEVTLHTDASLMPDHRKAWASWNVVRPKDSCEGFVVTYCMNMLQSIDNPAPLLVSLNANDLIDKDSILLRRRYHHPVYTPESLRAQRSLREYSGHNNTYFAGAYMGWGFHEDGMRSAQRVVDSIATGVLSRAA